jgi:hypothetical protein
MHSSTLKWSAILFLLVSSVISQAQDEGYAEPDAILLKDGSTRKGVIVKNTADTVFLQERYRISEISKSGIVRIFDGVDTGMEYTDAGRKGRLPSWRVMVNDIRNNDAVRSSAGNPSDTHRQRLSQKCPLPLFPHQRIHRDERLRESR